jgi:hypothetical protein
MWEGETWIVTGAMETGKEFVRSAGEKEVISTDLHAFIVAEPVVSVAATAVERGWWNKSFFLRILYYNTC